METIISAVLGDIVSRAISVVVQKFREQTNIEEDLQRLRQLLLRIHVVVEEADGRWITNKGRILQVSTMREQMFRGYFLLDAFRRCQEKKTEDKEVTLAQSRFNPAKRLRLLTSNPQYEDMLIGRVSSKELKQVLLILENMVSDLKEIAIFIMNYPRIYRQPYGAYLYLDKYMFGRQTEREQAINFLLQAEPLGGEKLGVLPIVGPGRVGKSTLVEHVCDDERVRSHFSLILMYSGNDLKDETAMTFRDHCVIKHQNITSGEERSLVVIELLGDEESGAWKRRLHSAETCMTHGSKIIITSRSEKTVSLGTTKAIKLKKLSKEAYWYFFKMLIFGSTDPEEHPKLTSIAMELALEMRGSFIFAYTVAALLRENLGTQFWSRLLTQVRKFTQSNTLLFGEYPLPERPRYGWSIARKWQGSKDMKFFMCGDYQKGPASQCEVPKITSIDLLCGTWSVMPRGKFEALSWRSLIPPYYSYVFSCEFVQHREHQDIEP